MCGRSNNDAQTINGLPLPSALVHLIEAGRWKRPSETSVLQEITGVRYPDLDFLDIAGMERETKGCCRLASRPQDAELYGLASSAAIGRPIEDPSQLDVDLAVMIAVNRDEEALFLDYRQNRTEPAVVVSTWEDGPNFHREVAPDFERFANQLGLGGPALDQEQFSS